MKWPWKKSSTDPLLRLFHERYHLNLLSVPRADADVGEVYLASAARARPVGPLGEVLTLTRPLPPPKRGERMADVGGTFSSEIETGVGLRLLEGLMLALGAGAGTVEPAFKKTGAACVRFRFRAPTRDSLKAVSIANAVTGTSVPSDHSLIPKGARMLVVAAVARTSSVSWVFLDANERTIALDAGAPHLADGKLKAEKGAGASGELTYEGDASLAFGVELLELEIDRGGRVRVASPPGAMELRDRMKLEPVMLDLPDGEVGLHLDRSQEPGKLPPTE